MIFLTLYFIYVIYALVALKGASRFLVFVPAAIVLFGWLGLPVITRNGVVTEITLLASELAVAFLGIWFWKVSPWPMRVLAAALVGLVAWFLVLTVWDWIG